MPIGQGIWRLSGNGPERISFTSLAAEQRLEAALVRDFSIIDPGLLVVGRQVPTAFGKFIDILAIDRDGALTIVELKRDQTPREVVAQTLDYASWVQTLSHEQVIAIFEKHRPGEVFEQAFEQRFGSPTPERVNEEHRLLIVGSHLDRATERIIRYLADGYNVPINAAFFNYFEDNGAEYLTRTWLVDPDDAEANASKTPGKGSKEPWNGKDFYVSFGEDHRRRWADAVKYGFISAGGGRWFTNTLSALQPGNRVFACIPKVGYVGAGIVTERAAPVNEFTVGRRKTPILDMQLESARLGDDADDPDRSEYLVRVDWIKTVPVSDAVWEKGMFANQNSACKLRNKFTLETLIRRFALDV
jgi:hypothetical protein